MTYIIGVTGHRKLLNKEQEVLTSVKTKLLEILSAHRGEVVEVITGMALGFDQTVCRACLELDIPYVAAVPCDAQERLWSAFQKDHYKALLFSAARVVNISPGPYKPWKMHVRNTWIVNNSQEMIVHWDGFYQGGTGACMKIVKAKKIPFFNTVTSK